MLWGTGEGLRALLAELKVEGLPAEEGCFEYQPDLTEGTCIDFSLPLQSGARVNFEIKYTESEFGSAKADSEHKRKFNETYKPRLAGRFKEPFFCETWFLEHYQIARNIWHMNEGAGDIAVFLFPKANSYLRREEDTIRTCALEPFRSRIRIVYLEDLILGLKRELEPSDTEHRQQLKEFRQKYFPLLK